MNKMKRHRRLCQMTIAAVSLLLIAHNWLIPALCALNELVSLQNLYLEQEAGTPLNGTGTYMTKTAASFASGAFAEKSRDNTTRQNTGPDANHETETMTVVPYLNKNGKCHLKVLVYDKSEELGGNKRPTLKDLVKRKVGGRWTSELKFRNDCSMTIVFGNDLNNLGDVDAVVVHIIGDFVPRWTSPHINRKQTWIFFSWKPPEPQDSPFPVDATWTYHRKSTMRMPYGYYIPGKPMTARRVTSSKEWVAGKTKKVLWIASHCDGTTWPRLDYVKELSRHIPVDIFGKCGTLECQPHDGAECMGDLLKQYKFYLAFENRECEDYITEKAWEKPLQYGTVPVVYGPTHKDYEQTLPPNSFIHISDFESVQKLAEYLLMLDLNTVEYAKYLEWRYNGSVEITRKMFDSFPPKMFGDIFSVMAKRKVGKFKRTRMGYTNIYKTCRDQHPNFKPPSKHTVGTWRPW